MSYKTEIDFLKHHPGWINNDLTFLYTEKPYQNSAEGKWHRLFLRSIFCLCYVLLCFGHLSGILCISIYVFLFSIDVLLFCIDFVTPLAEKL